MSLIYTHQELFKIQCELEQEMLDKGVARYRKNLAKAQEKGLNRRWTTWRNARLRVIIKS